MVKQSESTPPSKNKTLILGASTNPNRYAFLALKKLQAHNFPVVGIGVKAVEVDDVKIYNYKKEFSDIDTVTLYVSAKNQIEYYDYVLQLEPRRVIFNPGTQNPEFEKILVEHQIEVEHACTLVMLSTQQY